MTMPHPPTEPKLAEDAALAGERRRPAVGRYVFLAFAVMAGALAIGALPKLRQRDALTKAAAESGAPKRVLVGKVTAGSKRVETTLPGSVAPFQSAPLYARTTGFVRSYKVDLGDRVKAGDLLAVIDAPETKEELQLAEARKREAELNLDISKSIAERKDALSKSGLVSQQDVDEQRAKANSAAAALGTTRAEVGRIGALMNYQRIVAPFDGVVVRRGVEVGSLVTPNVGSAGTVLFEIGKLDTLKVFVDVPQSAASGVRVGTKVSVSLPSSPKAPIEGVVARTAGALDPSTRTLRTEIHVPGGGALLSGAFVRVRIATERLTPPLIVAASALVVRKEGTRIATLDASGRVLLKTVVIGRDLGKDLEIVDGLTLGDTVVLNASDDLVDGTVVNPVEPKAHGAP